MSVLKETCGIQENYTPQNGSSWASSVSHCLPMRLWQSLPFGVSLIDQEYRVLECNSIFRERFEENPEGKTLESLSPKFATLKPQFERAFEANAPLTSCEVGYPEGTRQVLFHHPNNDSVLTIWKEDYLRTAHEDCFSILSHELRTPLNFVTGFASILADEIPGVLNLSQRRYIEKILGGAQRMARLIEGMLDLNHAGKRTTGLSLSCCELGSLCQDILEDYGDSATAKGIHLKLGSIQCTPQLLDAKMIRQALGHLLDNAIKFTAQGGAVSISVHETPSESRVCVEDNGRGIHPTEMERIFDSYYQANMSTTRAVGGLGIGLALASRIICAHQGKIGLESSPDIGTLAWFSLPRRLA